MSGLTIPDGWYAVHAEGSDWLMVQFTAGEPVDLVSKSYASTHAAAGDSHAGIRPELTDRPVPLELEQAIARVVCGPEVDVSMVVVERRVGGAQ